MDTKNYGPEYIRDLIEEAPTTRELLQMALDALDELRTLSGETAKEYYVAHQIRAHLAKPEPVPVAWGHRKHRFCCWSAPEHMDGEFTPFYTKEQL